MMNALFKTHCIEWPGFQEFWSAYPRCPNKVAKGAARAMWNHLRPDDALLAQIMVAIEEHKRSKVWNKEGGQYIPKPENWLKDERWDDEIPSGDGELKWCHKHNKPGIKYNFGDNGGTVKIWYCEECYK